MKYELSLLVLTDASIICEKCQLGLIPELLIWKLRNNAPYHVLSWMSYKSKQVVKSVPVAEILVAAEVIEGGKVLTGTYAEIMNMEIKLWIYVDSKDIFTSLWAQRNSIDNSIKRDVSWIRYEFQTKAVEISWIPGKTNIADPLTKKDSALTEALQLSLSTGTVCVDLTYVIETKSWKKNFGLFERGVVGNYCHIISVPRRFHSQPMVHTTWLRAWKNWVPTFGKPLTRV